MQVKPKRLVNGFYFARPYHSCDRALHENTNGLIRRYLPKGTNFDTISEAEIKHIQDCLNNRPRKVTKLTPPPWFYMMYT